MIALIIAAAVIAPSLDGGPLITLADAKRVMAAAQADAARRRTPATLAIVDQYGELVLVQTASDARGAAVDEAILRARAMVNDGSETPGDQQQRHVASTTIARPSASAAPLMSRGKIVGAIGDVGGEASAVAKAGAGALK